MHRAWIVGISKKNFRFWKFVPKIGMKKWHIFAAAVKKAKIYNAFSD